MTVLAESLRLYGTDEPVAPTTVLRAGALSCELVGSELRHLRWRGEELLRGAAYLLRDRDWGTAPAQVMGLQIDETPDRFEAGFTLSLAAPEGVLSARARIEGHADGRLAFEVEATASHDIVSSRCGFVVLHPASCAGWPLAVEHTDGRRDDTCFPREISPGQPVFDIRALDWPTPDGSRVRCELWADLPGRPADKFEMEDQRNWSDASFKTYVGSLLDPWPYVLPAGHAFRQRVDVQVAAPRNHERPKTRGDTRHDVRLDAPAAALHFGAPLPHRMPPVGLGMPHDGAHPSPAECRAVAGLRPAWLIAEADLARADLHDQLATVTALSRQAGAAVQLDVLCPSAWSPADAAARAAASCQQAGLSPAAVRLCPAAYLKSFQPTDDWPEVPPLADFALAAHQAFPGARIGGGMVTYFTELNRQRPPATALDFVGHTTCPIVHAADDVSVMETLQALPHIVHSVRAGWPGLAYRLGPVTLASARNPYGQRPVPNPHGRRLALADSDPRHRGQFGAAWHAGYAATVAPLGLELLAMLATHGPSGPLSPGAAVLDGAEGVVPAWAVWQRLSAWQGLPLVPCKGLPEGAAGLAVSCPTGGIDAMVVNLTAGPLVLSWVQDLRLGPYDVRFFHAQVTG